MYFTVSDIIKKIFIKFVKSENCGLLNTLLLCNQENIKYLITSQYCCYISGIKYEYLNPVYIAMVYNKLDMVKYLYDLLYQYNINMVNYFKPSSFAVLQKQNSLIINYLLSLSNINLIDIYNIDQYRGVHPQFL